MIQSGCEHLMIRCSATYLKNQARDEDGAYLLLWGGLDHQASEKQGASGGLEVHGGERVVVWFLLLFCCFCSWADIVSEETKAKKQQHTRKLYEYLANGFGAFAVMDMRTSRKIDL
jgi:hypothetical protein